MTEPSPEPGAPFAEPSDGPPEALPDASSEAPPEATALLSAGPAGRAGARPGANGRRVVKAIFFTCPACAAQFKLPVSAAGIAARCWKCGQRMRVPTLDEARAAPPAPSPGAPAGTTAPAGARFVRPAPRPGEWLFRLGAGALITGVVLLGLLILLRVLLHRPERQLNMLYAAARQHASTHGGRLPDADALAEQPGLARHGYEIVAGLLLADAARRPELVYVHSKAPESDGDCYVLTVGGRVERLAPEAFMARMNETGNYLVNEHRVVPPSMLLPAPPPPTLPPGRKAP